MSKGHDESAYFDHVPGSKGDSSMILRLLVPIDVALIILFSGGIVACGRIGGVCSLTDSISIAKATVDITTACAGRSLRLQINYGNLRCIITF